MKSFSQQLATGESDPPTPAIADCESYLICLQHSLSWRHDQAKHRALVEDLNAHFTCLPCRAFSSAAWVPAWLIIYSFWIPSSFCLRTRTTQSLTPGKPSASRPDGEINKADVCVVKNSNCTSDTGLTGVNRFLRSVVYTAGWLSPIQLGEKIIHIACILMSCYQPIIFLWAVNRNEAVFLRAWLTTQWEACL